MLEKYCNRVIPRGSQDSTTANALKDYMDAFNNGNLDVPHCDTDDNTAQRRNVRTGRSLFSIDAEEQKPASVRSIGADREHLDTLFSLFNRATQKSDADRVPELATRAFIGAVNPAVDQRSWVSVYSSANPTVPIRREQIPPATAFNGVSTIDLSADAVSVLELCSCSGGGGLVAVDYTDTGSAATYDRCGVCGGDGSSCHYAPIDSVHIQTRLGTQPLTVRVVEQDDNNVYELCYYHSRQPWDTRDFTNQAVRVGFEPHQPCSTTAAAGSCDSLVPFGAAPAEWCSAFVAGPDETTAPHWRFDTLGNASLTELDCTGDSLFTCPLGDGSAGYRVCRNISLADMLACKLRDGYQEALSTQMMPDHSVQYVGSLHATELVPVECDNPALCERVMHRASRRVRVRSNAATGRMTADFDSDNVDFEAHVTGVTCGRDDVVRVHFSTKVTAPWGRSVHLDTPVVEDYAGDEMDARDEVVITAMGVEDALENARVRNPCTERASASVPVCTQHWTARLSGSHQELRLVAAPHVDDHALSQSPLVMTMVAAVPCDSIDLAVTGVRSNEHSLADSSVVLFHDPARRQAFITDSINSANNSFLDGSIVFGRVLSAKPELAGAAEHTIRLDSFHICYAYPGTEGQASYVPFDAHHPLATGCMSPGSWLVSTLFEDNALTGDGRRLNAHFSVDGSTLDFQYTALASTTASPIYIDARWHVDWKQEADARQFASDRLSQHRAVAVSAGRAPEDFGEPLSGFHSLLTPVQMRKTHHLAPTQRRRVRSLMMIQTAVMTGLSADGLRSIYNGSVVADSDALTRQYGAYNDDAWYSGGYGYYQTQCAAKSQADNTWATPLTKSACSSCEHCDDHDDYEFPCVWPCNGSCWPHYCGGDNDCDDCWHYWWLWLIPLGLLFLAAAFIPFYDQRPPRQYSAVATTTTSPSGTSTSLMTLATQ